jgi:hypothetical protein
MDSRLRQSPQFDAGSLTSSERISPRTSDSFAEKPGLVPGGLATVAGPNPAPKGRGRAGEDALASNSRRISDVLMALPVSREWTNPGGEAGGNARPGPALGLRERPQQGGWTNRNSLSCRKEGAANRTNAPAKPRSKDNEASAVRARNRAGHSQAVSGGQTAAPPCANRPRSTRKPAPCSPTSTNAGAGGPPQGGAG